MITGRQQVDSKYVRDRSLTDIYISHLYVMGTGLCLWTVKKIPELACISSTRCKKTPFQHSDVQLL